MTPIRTKASIQEIPLVFSRKLHPLNLDQVFCNRLPPQDFLIISLLTSPGGPQLTSLVPYGSLCSEGPSFMCRVAPYTLLPLFPKQLIPLGLCDPDHIMVQWLRRNMQLSLWKHTGSERRAMWRKSGIY